MNFRRKYKPKKKYRVWIGSQEVFSTPKYQEASDFARALIRNHIAKTRKNLFVNVEANDDRYYWKFAFDPISKTIQRERIYERNYAPA